MLFCTLRRLSGKDTTRAVLAKVRPCSVLVRSAGHNPWYSCALGVPLQPAQARDKESAGLFVRAYLYKNSRKMVPIRLPSFSCLARCATGAIHPRF